MCRLYSLVSNELTKVDCSLVFAQNALMQQSRADLTGRGHADGWGIATYHDGTPEVQKKSTAAYQDRLFSTTAERIYSTAIVAHVRHATVGRNRLENTHPFVWKNWTFAHNGTLTGFEKLKNGLEQETDADLQFLRKGDTDSEQYFLWILTKLRQEELLRTINDPARHTETIEVIFQAVCTLASRCADASPEAPRLNFVLTNGTTLIGCRWNNSLYQLQRKGIYDCEICGIPHVHHHDTVHHRAVGLASEPVTHESWTAVDNHNVVIFSLESQLVA